MSIVVEPRYFGSISYYATMAAQQSAVIATRGLFDKRRKETHRCEIGDGKGGKLLLTVPIVKPHGIDKARWTDVAISTHNHWWTIHRESLATAYGSTPFFEFYIDRFEPFLSAGVEERFASVAALDVALDAELRRILLIPTAVTTQSLAPSQPSEEPLKPSADAAEIRLKPYYQAAPTEITPSLSVLDLIFNLGPEAALYLRSLHQQG